MRDEERGTRELPPEDALGAQEGSRRMADGIDGIPEQARPHPVDDPAEAGVPDGGRRGHDGAAQSTPLDERIGVTPVRAPARARGRATGGTMSEHERNGEHDAPGAQNAPGVRHDPQDRSGARALFVELRGLKEGSPEYAELRNRLVRMHLPLVEHLARRFRNRGEPLDDLTQVATIGLIKSVDRFDPDRGVEC
ncbi:sigma factor, partial [Streptomyces griseosporeus]|uniref:sigma factor n=1 Tax=Streptomyces griseosporeus TaxID=1910 RepID=UPI0036F92C98